MTTAQKANSNGNLFEIKTIQASAFRTLIEALKDILTEANLEFDQTGIKVMAMDESHTALVYLKLHADRFEEYYCPARYVLGVNVNYFFKLIKTMGNGDSLTLYHPASDPNKLGIRMDNAAKLTTTNYFLKLFDKNEEEITIPSISYSNTVTMPSVDFQKICRDMNSLGDGSKIEIVSSDKDLCFKCIGDFAEQETIITENEAMKIQRNTRKNEIFQGVYLLKLLVPFTKCTNLCPSIEIYLKNDAPILIKYTVANLGEVRLLLAPSKK